MVGYDDNNDALTLGDDDVLTVGDYEISYDSGANEWQAEYTPSGDVASVPKNQSGSLFPTDFADALAGKALADDGNLYSSVDTAESNATDWVFVGPGTFNEAVTIDTSGMTLTGAGYNTIIDGGTTGHAIRPNANNVTIKSLSVQTTAGQGNNYSGIYVRGADATINNVYVRDSDYRGIDIDNGTDCTVESCVVESADGDGIISSDIRAIVNSCHVTGSNNGIFLQAADDSIVANNIIDSVVEDGIVISSTTGDALVGGNRVINSGVYGLLNSTGVDCIVFNNRISDSGNQDLNDSGTNTTLDANLTGASN